MVSNYFFGRSILILPFQPCVTFPKMLNLHNQEATTPFPTSKMEDYSFSLSQAFFSINSQVPTIFATASSIHNPRTHHAMIRGTSLTWSESYEVSTKVFTYICGPPITFLRRQQTAKMTSTERWRILKKFIVAMDSKEIR